MHCILHVPKVSRVGVVCLCVFTFDWLFVFMFVCLFMIFRMFVCVFALIHVCMLCLFVCCL